jgi:putative hydroxymethylpyrimidine transport system ATP-binding protein
MAQRDLLFPWLSVLDNVTLGCRLRRDADPSSSRERAMVLLNSIGLAANGADLPDALSGGMRQRAALARTLMEDRPVLLMDEPFSAVDAITRVRLQNLAARLLGGRTVLLVTHDPLEALRLGHRIHVMSGRPANLGDAFEPPGPPPRDVDDPRILELQGDLLRRLAAAAL